MRIGVFVYESGQPLAIEAARVAAGQSVPVLAYDAASGAELGSELGSELGRLAGDETGAIAGLTSSGGFDLVSALAAARGWSIRHAAPAGGAGLLHWIVGPATSAYMPK